MATEQIERDIKYAHTHWHAHIRIPMQMHVQAIELTLNFDKRTRPGRVPRVATASPPHTHIARPPACWPKNQQLRQQDDNLFCCPKGLKEKA